MNVGYIYWIRNKKNGKVYIGQTINFQKRMGEHKRSEHNAHLKRAYRKYGIENFDFKVLQIFSCDSPTTLKRSLDKAEIRFIAYFDAINPEKGYNVTQGGGGCLGRHHTEDAKKRISEAHKGKPSNSSTCFKKGMTPWNKGKHTDNHQSKAVIVNGIQRFNSLKEAAKYYHIPSPTLCRYIKNGKQINGNTFKYDNS